MQVAGQQGAYVAHLINRGFLPLQGGMDQVGGLCRGGVRMFWQQHGHSAGALLPPAAAYDACLCSSAVLQPPTAHTLCSLTPLC